MNDVNNLLQNYYKPTENKQTDFSTAIKSSLDFLDSNPPAKYNRTSRFILVVTDEGEFIKCSPELIKRAEEEKYKIYTVGINVLEPPASSLVYNNLMELTANNREQMQIVPVPNELEQGLDKLLYEALKNSLDNATKSPVANNVQFVETLYSYLDPKSVVVHYPDSSTRIINLAPITNADGTKTIYFELPKGLTADSETDLTINSNLALNLPVSVTKNRHAVVLCSPASNTPSSEISYDWLQLSPTIHQDLTENQMNIRSDYSNDAQAQTNQLTYLPKSTTSLMLRVLNLVDLIRIFGR